MNAAVAYPSFGITIGVLPTTTAEYALPKNPDIYDSILPHDARGNVDWAVAAREMVASTNPLSLGLNREVRRRVDNSGLRDTQLGKWLKAPLPDNVEGSIFVVRLGNLIDDFFKDGVPAEQKEPEYLVAWETTFLSTLSIVYSQAVLESFFTEKLGIVPWIFRKVSTVLFEFSDQFVGRLTRHLLPLAHAPPVFS